MFKRVTVELIQKRWYKKPLVRVRFAPSPTGDLHLGGLRTALYNYLFSRKHNGNFLLRIEDTDQTRLQSGAMENLRNNLIWAGIIPDEDPVRGGPTGPYVQSKRLDIYKEYVKKLLDNGSAYRCFCTEQRLNLLRKEALKARLIPKYDNRCRYLDKSDVDEKLKNGLDHCIRFKLSSESQGFKDLIYGDITPTAQQEGDFIIIKADGYPTYHFANVVDDYLMEISHVLRGVEWLVSTPKHIEIYQAFGWTPPHFAHLPLILNTDGSKLSKRQGDIKVDFFRDQGIFPLALINYITHAGGGFHRDSSISCYSYQQLIKQFDINKINTNSSKLNNNTLMELNRLEICNLLNDENNTKLLVDKVRKLVVEKFSDRINTGDLQLDQDHIITILNWARNRINTLKDLVNKDLSFIWVLPPQVVTLENSKLLKDLSTELMKIDNNDFHRNNLKIYLKNFSTSNNLEFPKLMKILRSSLSGLELGPSVAEMMEILGKDKTLYRLNKHASDI
ncbi:probable glutamate--tRNA ligase, mitochondrial [Microplitis mediator]|uniref:probable glutamate--tRNA ligase, mitochondrial n=1 Tax=Microplitis mediator TaxID=375433 RepID=UPI002554BDA2|nr:probable glutamate--tRNA ligase, mitochondrial [Microplitis mediator]